jgi:chromosome partitioning protein
MIKMPRVIAIANEKGGVAKTTTTISLAGTLVENGKTVLLIDLDPQASLTIYLGVSPHAARKSVADILMHSSEAECLPTEIPNLDLIPSNSEVALAERFLTVRSNHLHILKQALTKIKNYDAIIIDSPPALGITTQNALVAADLLIIPVIPEYLAVTALRDITQLIQTLRVKANPRLSYRILFTLVDQRIKSHNVIRSRFREKFGNAIYETEIHIDTRLRDASSAGLPISHFLTQTRSAREYRALLQELNAQFVELDPTIQNQSPFF